MGWSRYVSFERESHRAILEDEDLKERLEEDTVATTKMELLELVRNAEGGDVDVGSRTGEPLRGQGPQGVAVRHSPLIGCHSRRVVGSVRANHLHAELGS